MWCKLEIIFRIIIWAFGLISIIAIYYKIKTEEEEYLGFKLIGYYFLASYSFSYNQFSIPIGFLIFILFFRPKLNQFVKRVSVVLGLVIFIMSPIVTNMYFERSRNIEISSMNLYDLKFNNDWKNIKNEFDIIENAAIVKFNLNFEKDGNINEINFEIAEKKPDSIIIYTAYLDMKNNKYNISPHKKESLIQYPKLMSADKYFSELSKLDLHKIKPLSNYDFYMMEINPFEFSDSSPSSKVYIINGSEINLKIDNSPTWGRSFTITGMEKTSESTWESSEWSSYILMNLN